MTARLSACVFVLVAALFACKKSGSDSKSTASAEPVATPAPVAAAPVAAAPVLPALPDRAVAAGTEGTAGPWVGGFKAGRGSGDAGLGWTEARAVCTGRGMDLCTLPEWQRACASDAEVGKAASWTATVQGEGGFVVAGGSGCSGQRIVAGSERDPARIGLCCDRAIAIQTANNNAAFLRSVSGKLLEVERALNQHSAAAMGGFLDESVDLYTMRGVSRKDAEGKFTAWFRQYPAQSAVHGTCQVTLKLVGDVEQDKWIAECDKLVDRGGEVGVTITHYEFGGPKTKLRVIKEPRVLRQWAKP
jgi:hypothetical protein